MLDAHHLTPEQYTRNQLAYDLRKLRAHGLIERPENRYVYALSDYGRKAAAMLVIVLAILWKYNAAVSDRFIS